MSENIFYCHVTIMCFYLTENACTDDIFGADHASQKISINSS